MKKIKIFLLTIAIVAGAGIAIAAKVQAPCESQTQYYWGGNGYYPAGIEGYDYICVRDWDNNVCTYTLFPRLNIYVACKWGKIMFYR